MYDTPHARHNVLFDTVSCQVIVSHNRLEWLEKLFLKVEVFELIFFKELLGQLPQTVNGELSDVVVRVRTYG